MCRRRCSLRAFPAALCFSYLLTGVLQKTCESGNGGGDTVKKLLDTLYILTPYSYLFSRNETICVKIVDEEKVSVPALSIDAMHGIEGAAASIRF